MRQAKIVDYVYNFRRRGKNAYIDTILREGNKTYLEILNDMESFNRDFEAIGFDGQEGSTLPYWNNPWFSGFDACSIYYLIARNKPKTYLEVGSGNSTKFARLAVKNRSPDTRIVSIDPQPRAEVDRICDEVIRDRFENVDLERLGFLSDGDVVFIDNSHRSFQNSDVTVCFTEFMPSLPSGITFGFHDIFLPLDYPEEWEGRIYNEQYLLAAHLIAGHRHDEIVLPLCYLSQADEPDITQAMQDLCPRERFGDDFKRGGGCFWLRRLVEPNWSGLQQS